MLGSPQVVWSAEFLCCACSFLYPLDVTDKALLPGMTSFIRAFKHRSPGCSSTTHICGMRGAVKRQLLFAP